MNKINQALLFLLALFAGTVIAQSYPEFDELDDDGDRNLSEEEVSYNSVLKRLEFEYDDADINGDGLIDRREYQNYIERDE